MIRTVRGDIAAETLGRTNYHEHLFQVSPLLPGDELDNEEASGAEAALLHDSGFTAMIDATPIGLGRRPEALARISETTGLHIVATTGLHREAHYPAGHWVHSLDLAARTAAFVSDIESGMPRADSVTAALSTVVTGTGTGTGTAGVAEGEAALDAQSLTVQAGLIKAGIGYWAISTFERCTLDAVAAAHRATRRPVMVHLEFCTAAHEVLDLLAAEGVASNRVVLAHADRDPDPGLHLSLAERGAWLGYDGMARARTRSDDELLTLTKRIVDAGAAGRVLLGGDVARATRYLAYGGMPGLGYLGTRYVPRLRALVGDAAVGQMLIANPAVFLNVA